MKITLKMLKAKNACLAVRRLFKKTFGEGGNVTLPRCMKAAKRGYVFWFGWASDRFFDENQRTVFQEHMDAIDKRYYGETDNATLIESHRVLRGPFRGGRIKDASKYNELKARAFFMASQVESN